MCINVIYVGAHYKYNIDIILTEIKEIRNTLPKSERLSGVSTVNKLFSSGTGFTSYPLRCVYCIKPSEDESEAKILVSVGKKYHKRAVKRNKVKRRIREAYRLNKHFLLKNMPKNTSLEIAFIYISKNEEDYNTIENGIKKAFSKLLTKIN
ncbi:MAG: ribonuclease P protein component [Rikenellaceae bacterium]